MNGNDQDCTNVYGDSLYFKNSLKLTHLGESRSPRYEWNRRARILLKSHLFLFVYDSGIETVLII